MGRGGVQIKCDPVSSVLIGDLGVIMLTRDWGAHNLAPSASPHVVIECC